MMKYFLAAILISGAAMAQDTNNNIQLQDPAKQMQQLQKQHTAGQQLMDPKALNAVMKMQQCINKDVGKNGFEAIQAQGRKQEAIIKKLCAEGKKEEAVAAQKKYAMEMVQSPEYKAMHECSKRYADALKGTLGAPIANEMKRAAVQKENEVCS